MQHALGDIFDISRPLAQIFIINLGKSLNVALGNIIKAGFNIKP